MLHCVRDRKGKDSDLGLFRLYVHKNEGVHGIAQVFVHFMIFCCFACVK